MSEFAASIEKLTDDRCCLVGRVDLESLRALSKSGDRLIDAGPEKLTVDLGRASFRGAGGLVLISNWIKRSQQREQKLLLADVPESLSRVARAYGMMDLLGLSDS